MNVSAYLSFQGTCREAFELYQKALGGEIVHMQTNGDSPMAEHTAPERQNQILHARLKVGDDFLMGSDAPPEYYQPAQGMSVAIVLDDAADAERIFNTLSEGGNVTMPMQETFWAPRFGMLTDRFGIAWIINCDQKA